MTNPEPWCVKCNSPEINRDADHIVPVREIYSEGSRELVATASEGYLIGHWKMTCRSCGHRWLIEGPPLEKVMELLAGFRAVDEKEMGQ